MNGKERFVPCEKKKMAGDEIAMVFAWWVFGEECENLERERERDEEKDLELGFWVILEGMIREIKKASRPARQIN